MSKIAVDTSCPSKSWHVSWRCTCLPLNIWQRGGGVGICREEDLNAAPRLNEVWVVDGRGWVKK